MDSHRRYITLIGLLILLPFLPGVLYAQSPPIRVRAVSPALVAVEPGEIFTLSFRVTHRGDTREEFREELRLPDGWRLVMPLFEFSLDPGGEITRLAVIRAGRAAPAGDYEITYTVTSLRDYALTDIAVVRAVLHPVYDLSLMVEGRTPEQVIAGEPFDFHVRLINQGNVDLAVDMDARLPDDGQVTVTPASFRLARGESRLLHVAARTGPAEHRLSRRHVRLEARTDREIDGRPITARLSIAVDVVPLVAGQDMYYRYPMALSGYLGGDEDDLGVQVGLTGAGYLDEDRRRRLDFFLQAPDRQDSGVLGRRDEYWARYGDPRWSVKAGDQAYALSQLTSWYRYGRGVGADLHPPDSALGIGLYHVQDRWSGQKRNDTGGYVSFSPQPWATLRLNLLTLDYDAWQEEPSARDNLISFQGDFHFREKDRLEAEIGTSSGDRDSGGSDTAWRIGYLGEAFREVRYALSGRWAGPDYAGRYADTADYSGTVSFPLSEGIRGSISYRRYENNVDTDPERGAALRENLYQGGVTIRLPYRWRMNLDYDFYDQYDDQPEPDYEFREHGARLGLGRSSGPFSYRAEVRRAWTEDLLTDERYGGWNYTFSATYQPSRVLYLSFHGELGDDKFPEDSRLLRRGRTFSGTVHWQPTMDFSAYVRYSRYDLEDPDQPVRERVENDQFGAGFSYRLPNDHRLGFDIRRSDENVGDAETSYFASYTIPFAVPLGRKKSVGALAGQVYRADEPGEPGVAGAVVYVDGTATRTDSTGRFVFKTLPPGEYHIRLDERSVGLDFVPVAAAPRKVTVTGGKTSESAIALTRAGRLSGRVVRVSAPGNNPISHFRSNTVTGHHTPAGHGKIEWDKDIGLGNLLVELARPGEVRRTISDRHGVFLFERLHPGEWILKVYDHNLPEHHYLEVPRMTVSIDPGAEQEVTVRVLPRLREIRFIDEGRVSANLSR